MLRKRPYLESYVHLHAGPNSDMVSRPSRGAATSDSLGVFSFRILKCIAIQTKPFSASHAMLSLKCLSILGCLLPGLIASHRSHSALTREGQRDIMARYTSLASAMFKLRVAAMLA